MTKKTVKSNVIRVDLQQATYFITTLTYKRNPIFANLEYGHLLRYTMREAQKRYPYKMHGFVILPDHSHLQIELVGDTKISKLMQCIKRNFTRNVKKQYKISEPLTLWHRSFYDHVIRNEQDFQNHLDYIHYNPVKHGYVSKPELFEHSSFKSYVERGRYELGWGYVDPSFELWQDERLWEWSE